MPQIRLPVFAAETEEIVRNVGHAVVAVDSRFCKPNWLNGRSPWAVLRSAWSWRTREVYRKVLLAMVRRRLSIKDKRIGARKQMKNKELVS
jgi:hypothetical protein